MLVCSECGTQNRDRARFCRGCTASLVAATVVQEHAPDLSTDGDGASRSTRACPACQAPNPRRTLSCLACGAPMGRRRSSSSSSSGKGACEQSDGWQDAAGAAPTRRRWLLPAVVLLVLAGAAAAWWWTVPHTGADPRRAVAGDPLKPAAVAAAAPDVPQAPTTVLPAPLDATTLPAPHNPTTATGLALAVEDVRVREERKQAERIAAQDRARAARIAERQRVQEARVLAAKEAAIAAALAQAAVTAAAPAPPPVPAPDPVKTVEQTCAGETNIFARDFCRIAACRQSANASDAICVSYRQMEAERRSRMAN